jgi:hypothetical protein
MPLVRELSPATRAPIIRFLFGWKSRMFLLSGAFRRGFRISFRAFHERMHVKPRVTQSHLGRADLGTVE